MCCEIYFMFFKCGDKLRKPLEHAPQAVNNHCFTVLEERGGDNVLCRDNSSPYSCRLALTHETNGMGASPWSHPNEGVCREGKWGRRRTKGGGWRRRGASATKIRGAAARPLRHITAAVKWMWKQEKALRNIDLMPQPVQGEDARSRLRALYFPPIQNLEFICLFTPEDQREARDDVPFCALTLCEVQLCR